MPFVKLDTGILDSTLWMERECREIFITGLLMAEPREFPEPLKQISVTTLEPTGFEAPPGWYGFIPAAGVGIIRRAGADMDVGMEALRKLGEPDLESRSKEFEGRRLIRVGGGYVVLNFMKYRDKDHTAAERARRYRQRKKQSNVTRDEHDVTSDEDVSRTYRARNITQAEAEAESREQKHKEKEQKPPKDKPSGTKSPTKTALAKSRHAEFKEAIAAYWKYKNPDVEMPWDGQEGKQLEIWLRAAPNTTVEQFRVFLRNRAKSEVAHTERPGAWIRTITKFADGPLDRFGKPQQFGGTNGNFKTNAEKRSEGNLNAVREFIKGRGHSESPRITSGSEAGPSDDGDPEGIRALFEGF